MYLVDTNIWLELFLEQEKADEVRQFLKAVEAISISEFSLYSIGIILTQLKKVKFMKIFYRTLLRIRQSIESA